MKILVIGAGVSGLSCAILLQKKGHTVDIIAKEITPNTTSDKAAAVWYPFVCGSPNRAVSWIKRSWDYYEKEILPDTESGCVRQVVIELFEKPAPDPWWKDGVSSFQRIDSTYLQPGYVDGYQIDGFVIDTSIYMNYLMKLYHDLGGKITMQELKSLEEVPAGYDCIINCSGLGARELCNDTEIYPCRGQIIKTKKSTIHHSMFEEEGRNSLSYVIPRIHDMVIGGTTQDNDWNLQGDPKDTEDIMKKAIAIYPELANVEQIEVIVGLRPKRKDVRLEKEMINGTPVIHNYGHGGAGYTLAWGCALEVVELV